MMTPKERVLVATARAQGVIMNKAMEVKRLIDGDAVESVLTEVDDNA